MSLYQVQKLIYNGQLLMHFAALHKIEWTDYFECLRQGFETHGPVREGGISRAHWAENHRESLLSYSDSDIYRGQGGFDIRTFIATAAAAKGAKGKSSASRCRSSPSAAPWRAWRSWPSPATLRQEFRLRRFG